jgi:hypothetical protein
MRQNIFNFCYRISINQLNEQLEAAITERVRVLIRGKTHLEVYQIKGKTNTQEMKQFLNDMFGSKGLEFIDIIVTEVLLPDEIKQPLDMKAQFGSLNEMEREKYNFDMRIINDDEELELLRQRSKLLSKRENLKLSKLMPSKLLLRSKLPVSQSKHRLRLMQSYRMSKSREILS